MIDMVVAFILDFSYSKLLNFCYNDQDRGIWLWWSRSLVYRFCSRLSYWLDLYPLYNHHQISQGRWLEPRSRMVDMHAMWLPVMLMYNFFHSNFPFIACTTRILSHQWGWSWSKCWGKTSIIGKNTCYSE